MKAPEIKIPEMKVPKKAELIEVCPRDGFQNVQDIISFDRKVEIIRKLAEAGFHRIEAVSFVSPKAIPQMADAKDVMLAVKPTLMKHGVRSVALVPNAKGVETALECGVEEVTYVVSVSEQHNLANVRRTPEQSMEQFQQLIRQYGDSITFRLSLATALGSPFGEDITTKQVAKMAEVGLNAGCKEIMIADTAGMSDPKHTYALMSQLTSQFGSDQFVMHLHDTQGMALANTLACLQLGIHKFEAAAGGLGGCPFAPGAAGNAATEDVYHMLTKMGIGTDVNPIALHQAIGLIKSGVHSPIVSHMAHLYSSGSCM